MGECSFPTGAPSFGYLDGQNKTPHAEAWNLRGSRYREVYLSSYWMGFLDRKMREGAFAAKKISFVYYDHPALRDYH